MLKLLLDRCRAKGYSYPASPDKDLCTSWWITVICWWKLVADQSPDWLKNFKFHYVETLYQQHTSEDRGKSTEAFKVSKAVFIFECVSEFHRRKLNQIDAHKNWW